MDFKNIKREENEGSVNLHEGHRGRVRKRVVGNKFVEVDDYQVLEYVLQMCIRRRDTNETAHKLIRSFGSFANVCDADVADIKSVGVNDTVATFLHCLPYMFRNYKLSKVNSGKPCLNCPQDIFDYLGEGIYHLPREEFYIVCLDGSNNVINQKLIAIGGVSQVNIKLKEVVRFAMSVNARKVVALHNRPTTLEEPSLDDIDTTRRLYTSLMLNGIALYDHLIVNYTGDFYSFAHNGWFSKFKEECRNLFDQD